MFVILDLRVLEIRFLVGCVHVGLEGLEVKDCYFVVLDLIHGSVWDVNT